MKFSKKNKFINENKNTLNNYKIKITTLDNINNSNNFNLKTLKAKHNKNLFKNEINLKLKSFFKKKININFDKLKEKNMKLLKTLRRIIGREKRKKILKEYPILRLFWNCTSKIQLMQIFEQVDSKWKNFIKFYLTRCLIFHLSIRQLKNVSELMRHRQNLFDSLHEPELLKSKINFKNNLIKNFCKGISNYVIMFYDDLIEQKMIPLILTCENKISIKKN